METSRKTLRAQMRAHYVQKFMEMAAAANEDVLQTKSNEFAFPVVDAEGNEDFVVVTIKIPTGTKTDVYDGYLEAECYKDSLKLKAEKAEKAAAAKARKIELDKKRRAQQALLKAKRAERKENTASGATK